MKLYDGGTTILIAAGLAAIFVGFITADTHTNSDPCKYENMWNTERCTKSKTHIPVNEYNGYHKTNYSYEQASYANVEECVEYNNQLYCR